MPDQKLALSILRREPQLPFNRHTHEFDELVLVTGGKAQHLIDDQQYAIGSGDCFVVHEGDEHEFIGIEQLHLINVLFDKSILDQEACVDLPGFRALFMMEPELRRKRAFESRLHLDVQQSQQALGFIRTMELELESRLPGFQPVCRALFTQLAIFLSRAYHDLISPQARELLRISRTLNYMESHHQRPISIGELAREANMSVRHYQRVFREVEACTPSEYLLRLRILKARNLLENDHRSITEIAFDCGFGDSNYFTRIFHKVLGISPREYRKHPLTDSNRQT